jgi:ABC-type proline/glycine betaine transport system substrate-binding protein
VKTTIYFIKDAEEVKQMPEEDKAFYLSLGIDVEKYTEDGIDKEIETMEDLKEFLDPLEKEGVMMCSDEGRLCMYLFYE